MTTLLAIDSCNKIFSCAVIHTAHRPVAPAAPVAVTYREQRADYHAQIALPLIKKTLQSAKLTINDIDTFAYNAGPGQFSTLRMLCAIARSLSYSQNKKLVAVPAFCALANANFSPDARRVKCAYPAHKDHVYWGCCRYQQNGWALEKTPTVINTGRAPNPTIKNACGAAFTLLPHLAANAQVGQIIWTNAKSIATTALDKLNAAELTNPLTAQPIYARKKVAQTIQERQQKTTTPKL